MSCAYYCLWYRLDDTDSYLIWFANESDGIVTDADGTAVCFRDQASLQVYARSNQMSVDNSEPILHDLVLVARWLGDLQSVEVNCGVFLSAWNLFADLASSVNGQFDADRGRTKDIYDKLFWGSNIAAITAPGDHFDPTWDDDERAILREVLAKGLELFRSHVKVN